MPRKQAFRVGRSSTGLGLFATAPIKTRAFIVEYKGRKLTTAQAEKLEARGNRYLYEINSQWTIDGTSRKNLARYANHSCRPNAKSHTAGHKIMRGGNLGMAGMFGFWSRHKANLIAEKAGRDELLRQRDIAIGERNELMRQRDIALGERNELLARACTHKSGAGGMSGLGAKRKGPIGKPR
jgi:hypothetical protein